MIGLPAWQRIHGYTGVVLVVIAILTQRIEPLFLLGLSIFFAYSRYNANKFGKANIVTLIRLILIHALPFVDFWVALVGIIIVLDVIDGLLARQFGESSAFGEAFDMECDALFVLILSFIYWQEDATLWLALLAGSMRYIYKSIINLADPGAAFRETRMKYASTIAGLFFVALFYYGIQHLPYGKEVLLIGSLLILISFGRSFGEFAVWRSKKQ